MQKKNASIWFGLHEITLNVVISFDHHQIVYEKKT